MIDPRQFISYLSKVKGIIPPFVLELVIRDGARYFIHSVIDRDEKSKSAVIRIWDFRAMTEKDIEELKVILSELHDRSKLADERKVHPKLDWANLRIALDDIMYCIEWHDRSWPEEEREKMGFMPDPHT
jgi:hypothetical protein